MKQSNPKQVSHAPAQFGRDEAALQEMQRRSVEQLGEFLTERLRPTHFVTLTFDPDPRRRRVRPGGWTDGDEYGPSEELALRLFRKRWIRYLEKVAQNRVGYVVSVERGTGGRRHVHAVVNGTGSLTCDRMRTAWEAGRADVQEYDSTRPGTRYVVKRVMDADTYWDIRL